MTFKTAALACATLVFTLQAQAAGKAGEIRQIDLGQSMAAVQTHGKVNVGDSLIATGKDATQCSLPVRELRGNLAMVDISSCSFARQLKVGQSVELSLINTRSTPAAASTGNTGNTGKTGNMGNMGNMVNSLNMAELSRVASANEVMGITVFGFYDNADKIRGDITGPNIQSVSSTTNAETGLGVGAEYAQYSYRSIGFYGNGAYEFGRDFKSSESVNGKFTVSPKPSLSMFLLGGGATFLINNNFYAKAGANYNLPTLASGGVITDIKGKLGFEGGVGLRFARNFNAELIYRKLNMSASGNDPNNGGAFTVDNLAQTGLILRGGYLF